MFIRLCAIALFVLPALLSPLRAGAYPGRFVPSDPPMAMPGFVFEDSRGRSLTLADFRGHPVLLNLWATWCGPCVEEMPSLDQLQADMKNQNLIVIALDQERDSGTAAAAYFRRHDIRNLTVFNDPSERTSSLLHVSGLPTSFLIDAKGMMRGFVVGSAAWASPEMEALVRSRIVKPGN
jgi:thiol-disulfide isomerase/thioredoxin